MQIVPQENGGQRNEMTRHANRSLPGRDRYAVALDAALAILEEVDTLPRSNEPVRLAKVIGIVLDAIYEAEKQLQGVQYDS